MKKKYIYYGLIVFLLIIICVLFCQLYSYRNLRATCSGYYNDLQYSDARLKENVENITSTDFNKLSQLSPKSYNFIGQDQERFGFIAQDVQNVFPNIVIPGANGMLSINYDDIIPLIVAKLNSNQGGVCVAGECLNKNDMANIKNMQKLSNYGNTSGEEINSSVYMEGIT